MALEEPIFSSAAKFQQQEEKIEEEEEGEEEEEWSSDSEVGDALDWLDSREGIEGDVSSVSFSHVAARGRPNAHGGLLSRPLQPISNRSQKYSSHIRANPLEVGMHSLVELENFGAGYLYGLVATF